LFPSFLFSNCPICLICPFCPRIFLNLTAWRGGIGKTNRPGNPPQEGKTQRAPTGKELVGAGNIRRSLRFSSWPYLGGRGIQSFLLDRLFLPAYNQPTHRLIYTTVRWGGLLRFWRFWPFCIFGVVCVSGGRLQSCPCLGRGHRRFLSNVMLRRKTRPRLCGIQGRIPAAALIIYMAIS
jgi:hypothetical protein